MKRSILRPHVTAEAALRLCDVIQARARADGLALVVAVVDTSGQLVAFAAEQGAPHISHGVARDKAFTAAMTGMPSQAWKELMDQMPANEREIVLRSEGYVATEGGLPIFDGEALIGGVGVSGAASGQADAEYAKRGLAALDGVK